MSEGATWIVGGTSGIGLAIHDRLDELYQEACYATGMSSNVLYHGDVQKGLLDAETVLGRKIDKIVYAAGANYLDWSEKIDTMEMLELYDINCVGLIRVLQECPRARRVVVIGSDAAWRPMRTSVAYCASKAALHMAVQVIARERASKQFRINVVAPGKVKGTAMTEYTDARSAELRPVMDHIEYQKSQIPSGDFCTASEIAEVACDVLMMNTEYLNGAIIPVNGGRS